MLISGGIKTRFHNDNNKIQYCPVPCASGRRKVSTEDNQLVGLSLLTIVKIYHTRLFQLNPSGCTVVRIIIISVYRTFSSAVVLYY